MKNTNETIAAVCARCDSAAASASESIEMVAKQSGPRNRAKWRKEHMTRVYKLDAAVNALARALFIQPHAQDELTATMRSHANRIHDYGSRSLNSFLG